MSRSVAHEGFAVGAANRMALLWTVVALGTACGSVVEPPDALNTASEVTSNQPMKMSPLIVKSFSKEELKQQAVDAKEYRRKHGLRLLDPDEPFFFCGFPSPSPADWKRLKQLPRVPRLLMRPSEQKSERGKAE